VRLESLGNSIDYNSPEPQPNLTNVAATQRPNVQASQVMQQSIDASKAANSSRGYTNRSGQIIQNFNNYHIELNNVKATELSQEDMASLERIAKQQATANNGISKISSPRGQNTQYISNLDSVLNQQYSTGNGSTISPRSNNNKNFRVPKGGPSN